MVIKNYSPIRKASPAAAADDEVLVRGCGTYNTAKSEAELSGTTFAGTVHFPRPIMFRKG